MQRCLIKEQSGHNVLLFIKAPRHFHQGTGEGSLDGKYEALGPFLRVKCDWRETSRHHIHLFSQMIIDKNLDVAILFGVVERSNNCVYRDDP
jgi:hypothetical protein